MEEEVDEPSGKDVGGGEEDLAEGEPDVIVLGPSGGNQ